MYIVRNTVRQDLAKNKEKNTFIAHCGMRVNKQQESSSTTRMSTQFLKDDFPETVPNMDMKTGKGKKVTQRSQFTLSA
jgi:hypothetical protein